MFDEQALIDSIKAGVVYDESEVVSITPAGHEIHLPNGATNIELFCDRAGFDDPQLSASVSIYALRPDSWNSELIAGCTYPGDPRISGMFPLIKTSGHNLPAETVLYIKIDEPGIESVQAIIRVT